MYLCVQGNTHHLNTDHELMEKFTSKEITYGTATSYCILKMTFSFLNTVTK